MSGANILNTVDLLLVISGALNLILGVLVLVRGFKKTVNISYFFISIGVFIWIINLVLFDNFIY